MISFNTDGEFKDNYKFLIGSIVPRPIAVVSTLNDNGTNNVAPFSFFTAVSAKPMIIAFCPFIRSGDGSKKDTVINIEREKEFVVNFVDQNIAEQINQCAAEVSYGTDEFKLSKLTPIDSEVVKPKRIKESLIHYECILRDVLSYGEERGTGRVITGEVKKIHVSEEIYKDGYIDTDAYQPIGRGAGSDWIRCTDRYQMIRPKG